MSNGCVCFNSRTPVGCDCVSGSSLVGEEVSIHAPQWGATRQRHARGDPTGVSIHAPQWGATLKQLRRYIITQFQFTHPSGVRLGSLEVNRHISAVSIHAPQWGATTTTEPLLVRCGVSIHAPQWGATKLLLICFVIIMVSIHAPQWGATSNNWKGQTEPKFQFTHPSGVRLKLIIKEFRHGKFQFTHPSGVRPVIDEIESLQHKFQFTHPSGVRPSSSSRTIRKCRFNSRTPVGCDATSLSCL